MGDFKKLLVWQKAHVLALDVERVAGGIRGSRHASLRSQMTRAAFSIPANIVEGAGEQTGREFSRFLRIALNSTSELEYHVLVARDLRLIQPSDSLTLQSQALEIRKMLFGLRRHLANATKASAD